MKLFSFGWLLLLLSAPVSILRADLVARPSIDWVSLPASASLGQTVNVGMGAHANLSDNSDGNDWNSGEQATMYLMIIELQVPGQTTWTRISEGVPHQSASEVWRTFQANTAGTYGIRVEVMDGRPWWNIWEGTFINYTVTVDPPPGPVITSPLSVYYNQKQDVSYQITAANDPTSFNASGLPPGLSVDTTNGAISGAITSGGTWNTTITATNANGSTSATLTWNVTGASISVTGSVSPITIYNGAAVTLTRDGDANFGIVYFENKVLQPNSGWVDLGNTQKGSSSYTPSDGVGTYNYWTCIHDTYGNTSAQTIVFNVTQPTVSAPTNVQATTTGSTFVALSWTTSSAQAGVDHYNVYRNGSYVDKTSTTSFTDSTASPSSNYTYTVYAVDTQNHVSDASQTVNVATARSLEVLTPLP